MDKSFKGLSVTGLILLLALTPAWAVGLASDRRPIPPAARVTRAEATVRMLFRDEYERRTPVDRQALARKLLAEGQATPNDAAAQYVCYREAHDLATLGGDLPTAFVAVNTLAREFSVDPRDVQKMKVATFVAVARQVDTPEANAAFAEVGLDLLGQMHRLKEERDQPRFRGP